MPNYLKLNLQFFAAEGGGSGEGSAEGTGAAAGTDEPGSTGTDTSWIDDLYSGDDQEDQKENDSMIPKTRFDSVNSKYKELSASTKTLSGDYDTLKAANKELEGNYKVSTDRIAALEGVLSSMVDAELAQIDESYHDLIPQDKTVEAKLDWIIKAKSKGMFGLGAGNYEYEIGGMSNPGKGGKGRNTQGMNPLQLLTMGYGR